jgi:hypothetical protein
MFVDVLGQGFAVSDDSAGDSTSTPDEMSSCTGSVRRGSCVCTFVVTHFSTFAVVEADASVVAVSPNAPRSAAAALLSCASMIFTFFVLIM